MDANAILTAITTVGFPIVMCLMLMFFIRESSQNHKEELNKISEALNNNTLALQKISDMLGTRLEK